MNAFIGNKKYLTDIARERGITNPHEVLLYFLKHEHKIKIYVELDIATTSLDTIEDFCKPRIIPLSENNLRKIHANKWTGCDMKGSDNIDYCFNNEISIEVGELFVSEIDLRRFDLSELKNSEVNVKVKANADIPADCASCIIDDIIGANVNKPDKRLIRSNFLLIGILIDLIVNHTELNQNDIIGKIFTDYFDNGIQGYGLSEDSLKKRLSKCNKLRTRVSEIFEEAKKRHELILDEINNN